MARKSRKRSVLGFSMGFGLEILKYIDLDPIKQ
jgi:hypothetical protein